MSSSAEECNMKCIVLWIVAIHQQKKKSHFHYIVIGIPVLGIPKKYFLPFSLPVEKKRDFLILNLGKTL